MPGKLTLKIKEWAHFHVAKETIDFMSLNRLRLNLSASSSIPCKMPYALLSREREETLQQALADTSLTFDRMKIILNPYGQAPLAAVSVFHTPAPCYVTYTVAGHSPRSEYRYTSREADTTHFVPVFGLYPDENNSVTFTLTDSGSTILSSRTIRIKTEPLPEELAAHPETSSYPFSCDSEGNIRYYLTVPADTAGLIAISNDRYLLAEKEIATPTFREPQSTHLHELNLLGRFYRTYYIASGIHDSFCEKEPGGNLLVLSNSLFSHMNDTVLEIDRQTGAVKKTWDFRRHFDISQRDITDWIHLDAISYLSDKNSLLVHSRRFQSAFQFDYNTGRRKQVMENAAFPHAISIRRLSGLPVPEKLLSDREEEIPFSIVGWLNAPKLYQGASIETTNAIDLNTIWEKYKLRFTLSGDTLLVEMGEHPIQEILFAKIDRIYQLDMTAFLSSDNPYSTTSYTLAVPFTEMYSGTYTVILRFADGGQEILSDTITLSRSRKVE